MWRSKSRRFSGATRFVKVVITVVGCMRIDEITHGQCGKKVGS